MPAKKKPASKRKASRSKAKGSKSRTPAKRTTKPSAALWSDRVLPFLRDHATQGAVIAAAIIAGIGIVLGVGSIHDRAAHWIENEAPAIHIAWPSTDDPAAVLTPAPADADLPGTWMPEELRASLAAQIARSLTEERDPFRRENLRRAAAALEATGWIEGPATARRRTGDIIELAASWRVPAAVVRQGDRDYMVDWQGRRLPMSYPADLSDPASFAADLARQQLRRIIGAPGPLPRTQGGQPDHTTPWPGEPVHAALALLEAIAQEPYFHQVAAIDVSQFRARSGMLIILTDRGTTIEWGHRPDVYRDEPVSPEEKLLRLRRLFEQPGVNHIDAGTSGCRLYTPEIDCPPPG